MTTYALTTTGVTRLEDGAAIPNDPGNSDWREYQGWLTAGGVPRQLSPGPQYDWNGSAWVANATRQATIDAAARLNTDIATVRADAAVVSFLNMTPAQIDAYVDSNFPGTGAPMPNLRVTLKILGKTLAVTARYAIATAT